MRGDNWNAMLLGDDDRADRDNELTHVMESQKKTRVHKDLQGDNSRGVQLRAMDSLQMYQQLLLSDDNRADRTAVRLAAGQRNTKRGIDLCAHAAQDLALVCSQDSDVTDQDRQDRKRKKEACSKGWEVGEGVCPHAPIATTNPPTRGTQTHSQKAKTVEAGIGSQGQERRSQARKRTICPSHGYVKKQILLHPESATSIFQKQECPVILRHMTEVRTQKIT
ncbi:hypothetical protein Tco_0415109 [Tanacetum coccineum]